MDRWTSAVSKIYISLEFQWIILNIDDMTEKLQTNVQNNTKLITKDTFCWSFGWENYKHDAKYTFKKSLILFCQKNPQKYCIKNYFKDSEMLAFACCLSFYIEPENRNKWKDERQRTCHQLCENVIVNTLLTEETLRKYDTIQINDNPN